MSPHPHRKEKKLGPPFVVSLLLHLGVLLVGAQFHLFTAGPLSSAPVYYVDLVNLPVANPQAGAAGGAGGGAPEPAAPPPPPAPPAMKLPTRAPQQTKAAKAPAPAPPATSPRGKGESSKEFEERLARLERDAESRRQAAVLDALRKKVTAGTAGKGGDTGTANTAGKGGAPGASGTQAGSYYDTYIRSRLEDAFQVEDTFKPDQNKVVVVRITIGRTGKITSLQVDQNSSDKMFNDAVMRTITRAERDFPPTPTGAPVELHFRFRPQEVRKQ
jgi:colicin import membrane protein